MRRGASRAAAGRSLATLRVAFLATIATAAPGAVVRAAAPVSAAAPAAAAVPASAGSPGPASASAPAPSGATALDRYLAGLASLQADFSQTLTDSRGRNLEALDGKLIVLRPGRFRWEVRPRGSASAEPTQLMVADGRNVWFYDRELEQVTVKPAAGALTATPAMLLSGTVDIHAAFELRAAGRSAGLEWVRVIPRRGDAEFREARLGFAAGELRRMEIDDKLGQRAVLTFAASRRNFSVPPEKLQFTPPPGVDVIGKPVA